MQRGYGGQTRKIVKENGLVTVCEEAGCPNIGECWDYEARHLHDHGINTCTRACNRSCNVKTGMPPAHSMHRRRNTSPRPRSSRLAHIVVTSVGRDDLADGGAEHFAQTIRAIRAPLPDHHDRNPDAGFFAQGRRALEESCGCGKARRVQPQSGNGAVALPHRASGRALFPFDPAATAGQGNRSDLLRPASWSGSARPATRCCR